MHSLDIQCTFFLRQNILLLDMAQLHHIKILITSITKCHRTNLTLPSFLIFKKQELKKMLNWRSSVRGRKLENNSKTNDLRKPF